MIRKDRASVPAYRSPPGRPPLAARPAHAVEMVT
jgi:hypothetical protein